MLFELEFQASSAVPKSLVSANHLQSDCQIISSIKTHWNPDIVPIVQKLLPVAIMATN